jgi:polysaccharide biosynthesis/export protein
MSDMIRSGNAGRCALALVVLFGSLTLSLGQEPTAAPSTTGGQDTPKPDAKDEAPAKPAAVPPQEAPATPATTTPPVAAPAASPQTTGTTPPASQPDARGKASSKKGKNAVPTGSGQVTNIGVQAKPYEIGPEDYLYLNVLHQPDVSSNLEVRPDGYVSVRFAGEVRAAGLTAQQLSDAIAEKLTVYFNHPEVNIQVLRINSKKYYIAGGVRKPGAYPLTTPKTVYEALIEAGGLADFAKKTKIYVLRGQQRLSFNYKQVSAGKDLQQNILLQNGDVIQVPE